VAEKKSKDEEKEILQRTNHELNEELEALKVSVA